MRAGVADRPELYRWSSHSGYLSTASEFDWLHKGFFLSILSPRKRDQTAAYRRYMGEEDREEITRIFSGGKWPPIIGDEEFINHLKTRSFEQKTDPQAPDPQSLAPEVRQIVQAVCSHYLIDESELVKCRRRRFNEPRAVAAYLIRMMRKDSFADIGSAFGLKSYSAVGGMLDSMRKRLALNQELIGRCRLIKRSLITGQTEI